MSEAGDEAFYRCGAGLVVSVEGPDADSGCRETPIGLLLKSGDGTRGGRLVSNHFGKLSECSETTYVTCAAVTQTTQITHRRMC